MPATASRSPYFLTRPLASITACSNFPTLRQWLSRQAISPRPRLPVGRGAVPAHAVHELPRSFLRLTGRDDVDAAAIFGAHRLLQAQRPLVECAPPVAAQCRLRKGGDLASDALSFGQRRAWLDQPLHQTDTQRLLSRHWASGQDQVERAPCPTIRGSRTVPRSISGTPNRRLKTPSVASRAATRRSHHNASSRPPATA